MINTCSSNESSDTPLLELPGGGQDAGPGVREGPRQPAGDQAPQRPPHDQVDALEGTSDRPMLLLLTCVQRRLSPLWFGLLVPSGSVLLGFLYCIFVN